MNDELKKAADQNNSYKDCPQSIGVPAAWLPAQPGIPWRAKAAAKLAKSGKWQVASEK